MKKAKLREQVVKLKALADGNANPHEAAAAREKVRELESILSSPGTRGVFEKIPGSGIFWIRFVDSEGKYRREKIGQLQRGSEALPQAKNSGRRRGETTSDSQALRPFQ